MELIEEAELRCNPTQMHQVVYNIVSNALKFASPGVSPKMVIRYELSLPETSGQQFHAVSLSDNGIGFDPEFQDKVFELFQRLDTRETTTGTGTGLAIVKKIMENHGGRVQADSRPGQGTTITLFLPA